MPTAAQIDKACKQGFYVHTKHQQISGATSNFHGDEALPGNVHVYLTKTGLWDEVRSDSVIITSEPFSKEKKMATGNLNLVDATRPAKRNGKRAADGHTGLPSESQARAAASKEKKKQPKGDATTSLKDLGEIVGAPDKVEAPPVESAAKEPKKKGKTTVTVSRTLAKQGELPGVQTSKRKIAEIETLAEELEDAKIAKKAADDKFKDCEENLIISMEKHERTTYSRKTWGTVEVKKAKTSARFKRDKDKIKE